VQEEETKMAKKTTLRTPKINEQGEKEYDYIYPQTLADIVHLEDGTSVEEKIRELEQATTGVQLAISAVSFVYAYNLFIEAGYTNEDFLVGLENQQYLTIEDNEIKNVSTQIEFLVIPEGVTSIGSRAFENNQLKSVVIPNSVTSIGSRSFKNNKLTSVVIPNSVTSIGNEAFHTNQLTNVVIPNSITSISYGLFQNNQLTSIVIPDSVTSIEQHAFQNNQLTSVVIPDSVTSIDYKAFNYNQLTEVIFERETPTYISSTIFKSNPDLLTQGSIYVPDSAVETYKAMTNYTQFASIIKPISERPEEDKVTQEYVDTAIQLAITGVLEGEV
jgi:hypothetical protein